MASRHKTGGKWRVRWRTLEGEERSRTCETAAAADTLIRAIESAHDIGREWEPERPVSGPLLIDVAEKYLRQQALRLDKKTLQVRTYQLGHFLRFVESTDGPQTVAALTRPLLDNYLRWLETPGTGRHSAARSRTTALRYCATAELMWSWAAEWQDEFPDWKGLIPRARRITPDIQRPATSWKTAPTWEEMAACVRAADGWLQDVLVVLYYTGLRPGQVMALRRSDIVDGSLVIRPELGKTRRERSGRVVPVSPHLISWLEGQGDAAGPWVVRCGRCRRLPRDRDVSAAWRRAGVRAVVWEGRPHTAFRGGFQSRLIEAGARSEAVEFLVGHKVTDTDQHYLDPDSFGLIAAVNLIPKLEGV